MFDVLQVRGQRLRACVGQCTCYALVTHVSKVSRGRKTATRYAYINLQETGYGDRIKFQ